MEARDSREMLESMKLQGQMLFDVRCSGMSARAEGLSAPPREEISAC